MKTFVIIVVILAILLIGGLIYFFVNRNNKGTDNQLINKLPEGDIILNLEMDDNQSIDQNILDNMLNDVE